MLRSLTIAILLVAGTAAAETRVQFVHFSDLDRIEARDGRGGLARVAAVVAEARAERRHVIVTHGGDALSPSLLSSFDQGAHMIAVLNTLDLDAFALGNHEFDFGPGALEVRLGEARFPALAANIARRGGAPFPGVLASRIVHRGGVSIGLYGLIKPETRQFSSAGAVAFDDPLAVAAAQAAALRAAGADFVVALAHLQSETDQALLDAGHADLILGGDDHREQLVRGAGGALLIEAAAQGESVAVVDVVFSDSPDGPAWRMAPRLVPTDDVAPDPQMAARIQTHLDRLSGELDIALGVLAEPLDTRRREVRARQTRFGWMVAEAMRVAMKADIGLTNGGGIRGDRQYAAGHVLTRRDVMTELPYRNATALAEISGADLRAALEHGVGAVENRAGRFPQVAGMTFEFDAAQSAGQRVTSVRVAGAPLEDARRYRIATNDFLLRGGDGYDALKRAKTLRIDPADFMDQHVMSWMAANLEAAE